MAGSTTLWWNKGSKELLIPFSLGTGKSSVMYLAWYDIASDKIVHLLSDTDFPERVSFWSVFPLNGVDKVGIRGKAVYIYDRESEGIVTLKKDFYLLENSVFLVAPNGPIDLTLCEK
jgi:hypothetical protein